MPIIKLLLKGQSEAERSFYASDCDKIIPKRNSILSEAWHYWNESLQHLFARCSPMKSAISSRPYEHHGHLSAGSYVTRIIASDVLN